MTDTIVTSGVYTVAEDQEMEFATLPAFVLKVDSEHKTGLILAGAVNVTDNNAKQHSNMAVQAPDITGDINVSIQSGGSFTLNESGLAGWVHAFFGG